MNWFAALVDKESFGFNTILNMIPQAVTRIKEVVQPLAIATRPGSWYPDLHVVTDSDLVQAYTYVAIVEQLKRLDALLAQTQMVSETIFAAAKGVKTIDLSSLGWAATPENSGYLATLAKVQSELSASHPVVQAADYEIARILNLLSLLANGDTEFNSAARLRMLDSFHNSLVSSWNSDPASRGQATRTLLQRALDQLSILAHTDPEVGRFTTFSVSIVPLSRLWVVRWELGSPVTINTVKSRVLTGGAAAIATAASYSSTLPISVKMPKRGAISRSISNPS
jgi:hypothetical protein